MAVSRRPIGLFLLLAAAAPAAQVPQREAEWAAPAAAAARSNPMAGRSDVVAGGGKIFQQRCATCHGADGRGTTRAPDLTREDVQGQTDGALFWKISHGNARTGMPSFSKLPEPQRWQLVLHLRWLGSPQASPPAELNRP